MNWIKATDKLPEKERLVLIYRKGGYNVAYWYGEDKDFYLKPRGKITDLISKMVQGFHWTTMSVLSEYYPKDYPMSGPRREIDLYEEHYNEIYWQYLPEQPKEDNNGN